jgi:hypothetical protein
MSEINQIKSTPSPDMIEFINNCKSILETALTKEWFQNGGRKDHQAYENWKLCNDILKRGAIRFQTFNDPLLEQISQIISDCLIFIGISNGNVDTFKVGDHWAIGDEFFTKEIRPRLWENNLYLNTIFELSTFAWYKSEGFTPQFPNKESFPDICITDEIVGEIFIECKRVESLITKKIITEIEKAKGQIKITGEESQGIILLNIDSVIDNLNYSDQPKANKICELIDELRNILIRKDWPQIVEIIIVWNHFQIIQKNEHELLINHTSYSVPINIAKKTEELSKFQYTGYSHSFKISYSSNSPIFTNKKIECLSDLSKEIIKPLIGLPRNKIIESVFQYDKMEIAYENDGDKSYIVGRHFGNPPRDFYLILGISEKEDKISITFGLKIPLQILSYNHQTTLSEMLEQIGEKFGFPITIMDSVSRYYGYSKIKINTGIDPRCLVSIHTLRNEDFISMGY